MSNPHLEACIKERQGSPEYRDLFLNELDYRDKREIYIDDLTPMEERGQVYGRL